MKKKILLILALITFLIVGSIMIYEKSNSISIIENIKNKINPKVQIEENKDITIVDITNLETGSNINHQHVFKTSSNTTQHWNECTICHEKENIENHNFTTTWALGYESCEFSNSYTKMCLCGYRENGNKPCVWDGYSYISHNGFGHIENNTLVTDKRGMTHARKCSICQGHIFNSYYMNRYDSGELHYVTQGENGNYAEYCCDTYGNRLTCDNLGTCPKCKMYIDIPHRTGTIDLIDNKLLCNFCGLVTGTAIYERNIDNNAPALNIIKIKIKRYEQYAGINVKSNGIAGLESDKYKFEFFNQEISDINVNERTFTITINAKLKSNVKNSFYAQSTINLNNATIFIDPILVIPDKIKPEITEISSENNSTLTEWSKSKPIVIKGTENYCDTVSVKIVEVGNEDNIIFEGGANVTNQQFEISCTPELEANIQGKRYKCIVTDTCENETEQEFEIAKVDAIPPEITSEESILAEWAKEKIFTATATDTGIGEVQIAFNDESKYELATANGNEFSRNYKFIGDIYSPKQAIVLYKDGLGNVSSKEVIIDKIDNTAPRITNANIHNNELNITSNDIKEGLGEGSGVNKYRYITSTEKLEYPEITKENSIEANSNEKIKIPEISKVKYVYIEAEDLVRKCKSSV